MLFATALFTAGLSSGDRAERNQQLNEAIERIARERTRLLRAEQERSAGRMLTPLAAETHGDVILVMVDEGRGREMAQEINRVLDSQGS